MVSKEEYYEHIYELQELYNVVKQVILDAEYVNEAQAYVISPVNEVRNAFDHVMKSLNEGAKFKDEFNKAKGHLYRAGFDAYEVIAIFKLREIENIRSQFRYEAINTAFPDYFSKFIPLSNQIKRNLANARANKMVSDFEEEKSVFEEYRKLVEELVEIAAAITLHISGIKEVNDEMRKIERRQTIWNYVIGGVVIGIMIGLVVGVVQLFIEYKYFIPASK